ncbi:MAG: alanine/glycine:cation symporter family protein [Pseudomonadota bacterium]
MDTLNSILNQINGFVWGSTLMVLLLGLGLYLNIGLRGVTLSWLPRAFTLLWRGRSSRAEGDIPPFQSLMTALSSTVGTGNIAGVAGAIAIGGPGAVFWMWVTALLGMATKYAEGALGVHFRERGADGRHLGGPMYYIRNGLGPRWAWMGGLFAFFAMVAAFGIGNTVQANSVADVIANSLLPASVEQSLGERGWPLWLPKLALGLVMATLVASVILGGIHRIGRVAARLVPLMAVLYTAGALFILARHIEAVPGAFATIVSDAFTGTAAAGGFVGSSIMLALQMGVARGIFSNEAGLGSAPIAHAAAQTEKPVEQGSIAMLGVFIDTLVICTLTALVIVISGEWTSGADGASLSAAAFAAGVSGGEWIVSIGLCIFAFTTLIGWSYYGERCCEYLFGARSIVPYRVLWVLMVPVGATVGLKTIWLVAEILNGLMAFPNLIALALLSPVVFKMTREAQAELKREDRHR